MVSISEDAKSDKLPTEGNSPLMSKNQASFYKKFMEKNKQQKGDVSHYNTDHLGSYPLASSNSSKNFGETGRSQENSTDSIDKYLINYGGVYSDASSHSNLLKVSIPSRFLNNDSYNPDLTTVHDDVLRTDIVDSDLKYVVSQDSFRHIPLKVKLDVHELAIYGNGSIFDVLKNEEQQRFLCELSPEGLNEKKMVEFDLIPYTGSTPGNYVFIDAKKPFIQEEVSQLFDGAATAKVVDFNAVFLTDFENRMKLLNAYSRLQNTYGSIRSIDGVVPNNSSILKVL